VCCQEQSSWGWDRQRTREFNLGVCVGSRIRGVVEDGVEGTLLTYATGCATYIDTSSRTVPRDMADSIPLSTMRVTLSYQHAQTQSCFRPGEQPGDRYSSRACISPRGGGYCDTVRSVRNYTSTCTATSLVRRGESRCHSIGCIAWSTPDPA
jgi:hypothetical protein